ncbi:MAG: HEAT repeat domain-containing protein [Deltaproteobacteria bacterium]|nr:HEAT repeat domain-containing protein [Deltaproteobacteria bacterium]
MTLQELCNIEPWEWPEGTADFILETLSSPATDPEDRLLAAEMAGDYVVANDKLAGALLALVNNAAESPALRSQAAISLGPALEHADIFGFDDPDDIVISEKVFTQIKSSLQSTFQDKNNPTEVRRSILEASVRAPQSWHQAAVKNAYQSKEEEWRLTAVFCMSYIDGFKTEILESLLSANPDIHYQAVLAAANHGMEKAWPHIKSLLTSATVEKPLIFAAIEAAVIIGSPEAKETLEDLLEDDDDEIADAVHEALAMLEAEDLLEDEEDDEE